MTVLPNETHENESEAQKGERWARYFHPANALDSPCPATREGREQAQNLVRLRVWEDKRILARWTETLPDEEVDFPTDDQYGAEDWKETGRPILFLSFMVGFVLAFLVAMGRG